VVQRGAVLARDVADEVVEPDWLFHASTIG
jgi:hypothetical protein